MKQRIAYPLMMGVIFLMFQSCKFSQSKWEELSSDAPAYKAFHIDAYDSTFYQKDFEPAWANRDTLLFKTAIDSLKTLKPDDVVLVSYNLSVITGFGWSLVDVENLAWFDTLSRSQQKIIINNLSQGFQIYKSSPLFMKKLYTPIVMHRYFDIPSITPIPLDSSLMFSVKRFLEDVDDDKFIVADNKEEIIKKLSPTK